MAITAGKSAIHRYQKEHWTIMNCFHRGVWPVATIRRAKTSGCPASMAYRGRWLARRGVTRSIVVNMLRPRELRYERVDKAADGAGG
jgi:hypothetical protein